MTNYPLGDFLIRIKNASLAGRKELAVPKTKLIKATALTLKKAGFLLEVDDKKDFLEVKIPFKKKTAVILGLKLVSRPGLRVYLGAAELEKRRRPSTLILSTPAGILTSYEAKKKRLGGEVIAEVW